MLNFVPDYSGVPFSEETTGRRKDATGGAVTTDSTEVLMVADDTHVRICIIVLYFMFNMF